MRCWRSRARPADKFSGATSSLVCWVRRDGRRPACRRRHSTALAPRLHNARSRAGSADGRRSPGDGPPGSADRLPARCGPRPRGDPALDRRVAHVAGDGLARHAQAGLDVPELAVAVGGLVQVHEVHVDGVPRQSDIGLRVQVKQRLLQRAQAGDPHLGRGEGVHPGDHADAGVLGVGLQADPPDSVGVDQHGLPGDPYRYAGGVELFSDLP